MKNEMKKMSDTDDIDEIESIINRGANTHELYEKRQIHYLKAIAKILLLMLKEMRKKNK